MKQKRPVYKTAVVAMFAALSAVLSQLSFSLGEVPFSLGILGAFLTGAMLSPSLALTAETVYLLLGAVGAPVFSGFKGGLGSLMGPTGGYLIGYLAIVGLVSFAVRRFPEHRLPAMLLSMTVSLFVCYAFGTVWFMCVYSSPVSLMEALWMCVIPFILPDIAKLVIASFLSLAVRRAFQKAHISLA